MTFRLPIGPQHHGVPPTHYKRCRGCFKLFAYWDPKDEYCHKCAQLIKENTLPAFAPAGEHERKATVAPEDVPW
jgi:hypothetical protein